MNTPSSTGSAATAAVAAAAALDEAIEALKTYDWGTDRKVLKPIEDAVIAALGDAGKRQELETRLAAVLETGASRDAKDYVCRKLRVIGTATAVPTLAGLLADENLSHMARYALERIQDPAAGAALLSALPKVGGKLKAGVAGSLGARQDAAAAPALLGLLGDGDATVVAAAATALGAIATPDVAGGLAAAVEKAPAAARTAVIDGALAAAEKLASAGKKAEAKTLYKALTSGDLPEHVKQAAERRL